MPTERDQVAIRFWSERYGRPIPREAVVEIRHTLKRFVGLLRRLEHVNWWSMAITSTGKKADSENAEAILLCRISSEKQEEGYSLDFQERAGVAYAKRLGLKLTKTWRVTESASTGERKLWEEFMGRVRSGPEQHILIPKVDRCLRNFDDLAVVAKIPKEYGKIIHFFDDGLNLHKDSPASDVLRLGVQATVAAWYSVDLSQKVRRGMNEKAAQGHWPEKAPFGYKNNVMTKRIDVDPDRAHWVRRIKELSAMGLYSLDKIRSLLVEEGYPAQAHRLHRNLIERIIRNPIYSGHFVWPKESGTLIKGTHAPIVTWDLHTLAIKGLERLNRPKYSKRDFPFAGLIRCGLCPEQRAVTFELKKGRFVYGHCTGVRKGGICPDSEYVRQDDLDEQFRGVLRAVQLTPEMVEFILDELAADSGEEATAKVTQLTLSKQELARTKTRIEQAYTDKLDGKISEDLWAKKNAEWNLERVCLEEKVKNLEESGPSAYLPTARRVLELSKRLENLYESAKPSEKRELIDTVCSNLFLRGKKVDFIYRKPFDLWAEGLSTSRWLPTLETPRTPPVLDRFPIGLVKNHRGRLDMVAPFLREHLPC